MEWRNSKVDGANCRRVSVWIIRGFANMTFGEFQSEKAHSSLREIIWIRDSMTAQKYRDDMGQKFQLMYINGCDS